MNCELIDKAKSQRLTQDDLNKHTELVKIIFNSDNFDVEVVKCINCGQLFLHCFRQYTSPDFEDDYWTFWIPIEPSEIDKVQQADILLKFMGEFVHNRSHICWSPDGSLFWAEDGFPLSFIVFLP